ncbi:hypothetical protein [Limnofasciculus baicalensis]|uniref:Uncharacterized protein n=1 Tax=Limnofasciculus baicalensis BBK-W-15 TaxID=2699891 RepID=A0AAE3KN28_9CYAN|nr:hypothetical protein [Limnofasciculus baicalensis]MCP2729869.1 hypothetical protein [Limnofasciculus baicalensis BBK-W-15]
MDIRKPTTTTTETETSPQPTSENKFNTGVVQTADAKVILPPAIQGKLSALGKKYGIPFDLSNIGLDGKMAQNVKSLRTIADMAIGDSKLLPEMVKLVRQLFRAEIKLAQFHKLVTQASVKHQEKLDKETADIFLMMAGYQAKSTKLQHRTNVRNQLKERRTQAYSDYYQNSVYGAESELIDVEFERLASDRKVLGETKLKKAEFDSQRKQKIADYVQSAFVD